MTTLEAALTPDVINRIARKASVRQAFTPRMTRYITRALPLGLTEKQSAFLTLPHLEAMYGGAAGGGKSIALLAGALQWVDQPDYAALILRRTFPDLTKPGALINRSKRWLRGSDAVWNGSSHTWTFPNNAKLVFGHMANPGDEEQYQGSEWDYIAFDEASQFTLGMYLYMFSRLRRVVGSLILPRLRAASNPGGIGHEWVKQRFITEGFRNGRVFIPATLEDNPHLDAKLYEISLAQLPPTLRLRMRYGDWNASGDGSVFKREWFQIVKDVPAGAKRVRAWDFAATEPKKGKEPDWTVGIKVAEYKGQFFIEHVRRMQVSPKTLEDSVKLQAYEDGINVPVYLEQEPGSSGVIVIDHFVRDVLKGFTTYGERSTGPKAARAQPVASAAEARNIFIVEGPWVSDLLNELEAFKPGGEYAHDDQVDALSLAYSKLAGPSSFGAWSTFLQDQISARDAKEKEEKGKRK